MGAGLIGDRPGDGRAVQGDAAVALDEDAVAGSGSGAVDRAARSRERAALCHEHGTAGRRAATRTVAAEVHRTCGHHGARTDEQRAAAARHTASAAGCRHSDQGQVGEADRAAVDDEAAAAATVDHRQGVGIVGVCSLDGQGIAGCQRDRWDVRCQPEVRRDQDDIVGVDRRGGAAQVNRGDRCVELGFGRNGVGDGCSHDAPRTSCCADEASR